MVNLLKVESMLNKVGAMPLDALKAWFPNERPEEIVAIIEKSDKFMLSGNKVLLKSSEETNKSNMVEIINNKSIDKIIDVEEVIDVDDIIDVEEVIDVDELISAERINEQRGNAMKANSGKVISNSNTIINSSTNNQNSNTINNNIRNKQNNTTTNTNTAKPIINNSTSKPIINSNIVNNNKPKQEPVKKEENILQKEEKKNIINTERKNNEIAYDDERVKSKVISNLTYDELLMAIECYNKKVKKQLDNLKSQEDKGNIRAIIEFLKERYDVLGYNNNSINNVYSLYKKGTKNLVSYGIIVDILDKDTLKKVDDLFNCETVFIYYIKECQVNTDSSLNTYFVKSANAIINKYKVEYNINASQHKLYVIEEKKGIK